MIRQTLTTLFCAALFTVITAIPSSAEHRANAPYFCTTMEAAMETVRIQKTGDMDALREKAANDESFKCWLLDATIPFVPVELMHQYKVDDLDRGFIKALAPDGTVVYLFGTMDFINWLMHEKGA